MNEIDALVRQANPVPSWSMEGCWDDPRGRSDHARITATPVRRIFRVPRRVIVTASATLAAAVAVAAVTTLAERPAPAYAVSRDGAGKVTVTLRQLRDPQGLQRRLAAYGIPSRVVVGDAHGHTCPDEVNAQAIDVPGLFVDHPGPVNVFTLDPSKLPHGAMITLVLFKLEAKHADGRPAPTSLGVMTTVYPSPPSCVPTWAPPEPVVAP